MNFEESGAGIRYPAINLSATKAVQPGSRRTNTMPVELVDVSTLKIVPMSDGEMPEGFYFGRKRSWSLDATFITVMVILSKDEPCVLEVHEPGRARITSPREWLFVGRVIGLREVSFAYRRAAEEWARSGTLGA